MDERSAATKYEVEQAIDALTAEELLNLRRAAEFRVRSLGRACNGRTYEDLLMEAVASTLAGSGDGGGGRRWNKEVSFKMHLLGAMRSIASHWREQFEDQEAHLESELARGGADKEPLYLDGIASNSPRADRSVETEQELCLIWQQFRNDREATQVLEGWRMGMTGPEIMAAFVLNKRQFEAAVKRVRGHPLMLKLRSERLPKKRWQSGN